MIARAAQVPALLLLCLLVSLPGTAQAAPNACTRRSERSILVNMRRATNHRGTLFAARGRRLRFRMPSGTDVCGGRRPEITFIWVVGRRADDVFSVKGSLRFSRGRHVRFAVALRGGIDTMRLIGASRTDRMTVGVFDTSSFVDVFGWRWLGNGRLSDVNRFRMMGRRGDDVLSGLAGTVANVNFRYSQAARMRLGITGGPGSDRLTGGRRSDRLLGQDGNDGVRGGKGDDFISGGDGRDFCRGGPGTDFITGC